MIQIDWQSRTPIYDQLIRGVVRLKALGVLQPGDKLPSVRSLAAQLGVNPNTVQKGSSTRYRARAPSCPTGPGPRTNFCRRRRNGFARFSPKRPRPVWARSGSSALPMRCTAGRRLWERRQKRD